MSHLLTKDTFDPFYMVEATIKMGISYQIDGHLNPAFFDTDTQHTLTREYSYWKEVRPKVFSLIRGSQPPLACKIILATPSSFLPRLLEHCGAPYRVEDIEGMYLNILYDPHRLLVTSGISYRTFSLDKTLDQAYEDYLRNFIQRTVS